ncbi:hypothetical protein O181_115577 [Austropuccinia psidii MF-1]|uniref:Uncharacterized protein n=1 Tax=Austropuccinia psidii MF-1 TaxID=1389203 RepID=A0A9Q3K7S6_9BASI|nr:hypothetical protein [Austropuccinia psidii MF-1]
MSSPAFLSFLKNPSKFVSNVPKLKPDGSNFTDWNKGLDNVFMYIFNKVLFTDDPDNFELVHQAKGALRFFIQQTIAPELSEMIQSEPSPKLAYIELQNNFKKSARLMQLEIVIELFEMYSTRSQLNSNDFFSKLFTLFDKYRRTGIPLTPEWRSLIVQIFAPIPQGMTQASWFNLISSELHCSGRNDPCDVQRLVNSFMVLVGRNDQQSSSQLVMKLAPKNKISSKNSKMDSLSNAMLYIIISSPNQISVNAIRK